MVSSAGSVRSMCMRDQLQTRTVMLHSCAHATQFSATATSNLSVSLFQCRLTCAASAPRRLVNVAIPVLTHLRCVRVTAFGAAFTSNLLVRRYSSTCSLAMRRRHSVRRRLHQQPFSVTTPAQTHQRYANAVVFGANTVSNPLVSLLAQTHLRCFCITLPSPPAICQCRYSRTDSPALRVRRAIRCHSSLLVSLHQHRLAPFGTTATC